MSWDVFWGFDALVPPPAVVVDAMVVASDAAAVEEAAEEASVDVALTEDATLL